MPEPTRCEPGTPAGEGEIPLCVPHLDGQEWAYVRECLDTAWVSSAGSYVDEFEAKLASRVGAERGVATSSGTAALHLALESLGIGEGDAVLVNTLTFIAPANAIRYTGAEPIFVDADPDTYQLDVDDLEGLIEDRFEEREEGLVDPRTGNRVRAIVPVHVLGHPCEMGPILRLADEHDLAVIEDATESLGAAYEGEPVGSLGDVAAFSFNGNKMITTGGGGMLVTDDDELADRARYLSTQAKDDPVEYVHEEIGYNYRLTNVQAALGVAQLEQLDDHVERKRAIAARYAKRLAELPGVEPMPAAPWASPVYWLYTLRLDPTRADVDRRTVHERLERAGIQTRPLWQPMHRSPAHGSEREFPAADAIRDTALSIPCSVGLTDEEQERVLAELEDALRSQGRGSEP